MRGFIGAGCPSDPVPIRRGCKNRVQQKPGEPPEALTMRYMMIHYLEDSVFEPENMGQEALDQFDAEIEAWDTEMDARGILVGGGRLRPVSATTTLRVR